MDILKRSSLESYPFRLRNKFIPLIGGDAFLSSLLTGIDCARYRIVFEMYLVEPGQSFDLLWQKFGEAASRGVSVFISLDGFGSHSVLSRCSRISNRYPNMHFSVYNPVSAQLLSANFNRDHRKLIVIDDYLAWTGGFGIVDDFYDRIINRKKHLAPTWMDVGVLIRGQIVRDWVHLFFDTWHAPGSKVVNTELTTQPAVSVEQTVSTDVPTGDHADFLQSRKLDETEYLWCRGRVAYGAPRYRQDIVRELVVRIKSARSRIWLISPYFVTTRQIRRLLRRASRRGIDVRVVVPGPIIDHPAIRYAGRRHYASLIAAGVRIFEYQPGFLHAKVFVCDDWVSVGSYNLDHWTYRWNLEANQEVVCDKFTSEMTRFYSDLVADSLELKRDYMLNMRLGERILVFIVGKIEAFVLRFLH